MKDEEFDKAELTKDEAFKQLYDVAKKYFRERLYGCEQDIEEMAADILIELIDDKQWNTLETHTLKGLRVWVWNAVYYKTLDFIKKKKRKPLIASIELAMQENPELQYENFATPPPDVAGDEEFKRQMEAIKRMLPPKDFQLFDMRLQGHSPPDIAKRLGISEGAERTRYCRIRKLLQIELKKGLK